MALNRKKDIYKGISIVEGDIVVFWHKNKGLTPIRHPFIVIEVNQKGFKALQITSVKYDEHDNLKLSYYQEQLVRNDNFVQVDERNGFKYHSLVICDTYYFIKWGKDKYELSKKGHIKPSSKLLEIQAKFYGYKKHIPAFLSKLPII